MLLEATPTTTQTIIREISADLETPISVYMKLRGEGASVFCLSPSRAGSGSRAIRLSASSPGRNTSSVRNEVEIIESDSSRVVTLDENSDPTYFLQAGNESLQLQGAGGCAAFHRRAGGLSRV